MTKKLQVYKCEVCGNIVEVLHEGAGELVCCNQPMKLMPEQTEEQGMEKHVPVVEKTDTGIKVKVGSVPHPMEEKHFIEWVAIHTDKGIFRIFLKAGEKPEADFEISEDVQKSREYCNIHGLWSTKK
jgi:superoxide reductase